MNEERLKKVLAIQSKSRKQWRVFAYIVRQFKEIGVTYWSDAAGNLYARKGELTENYPYYPCMVAHMDTVHDIESHFIVLQFDDKLTGFNPKTMRQAGIGGDDKVGIYIALEILRKFDRVKVAFFVDEEIGCLGSSEAHIGFFDNVGFVLQCDRQRYGEWVTSASGVPLASKSFKKDMKSVYDGYGYKPVSGLMTDVMALKELGINCSMANIACGYFHPHSDYEYVDMFYVDYCQRMVEELISRFGGRHYPHKYNKPAYKGTYGGLYARDYTTTGNSKYDGETPRFGGGSYRSSQIGFKNDTPYANSITKDDPKNTYDDWKEWEDEIESQKARKHFERDCRAAKIVDMMNSGNGSFMQDENQYCEDCGGPGGDPASGLCHGCFEWYKKTYGIPNPSVKA